MKARWVLGPLLLLPLLVVLRGQPPSAATAQPPPAVPAGAPTPVPTSTQAPVPSPAPKGEAPAEQLEVPPPPFTEGVYPCSFCHEDLKTNRTRRPIEDHEDIVLKHDEKNRWCLDCHDATNRDFLHLASGDRLPFEESYRLCGQCHGEKLRDWRAGVHGRRVGQWNGQKGYLLCVHCHSPHQPKFKSMAPVAAPLRVTRPR